MSVQATSAMVRGLLEISYAALVNPLARGCSSAGPALPSHGQHDPVSHRLEQLDQPLVAGGGLDHLVLFLSSRVEQAGPDDVVVPASAENGLAVDSAALVTKLFTLHESLIVRPLGRLSKSDHRAILERLVNLLRATVDL